MSDDDGSEGRPVVVPRQEWEHAARATEYSTKLLLNLVWRYGQNEFQPLPIRSLMTGDIIGLPGGLRYVIRSVGFQRVDPSDRNLEIGEPIA